MGLKERVTAVMGDSVDRGWGGYRSEAIDAAVRAAEAEVALVEERHAKERVEDAAAVEQLMTTLAKERAEWEKEKQLDWDRWEALHKAEIQAAIAVALAAEKERVLAAIHNKMLCAWSVTTKGLIEAIYPPAKVSEQADPKDAEPIMTPDRVWCISCGNWCDDDKECPCRLPTTVTNAAGGNCRRCGHPSHDADFCISGCNCNFGPDRSATVAYPFVHIVITKGPDKGKAVIVDIYDLVESIGYKNTGQMQAAKKLMRGGRDGKDWARDMAEAADSIQRAIEMEG